MSTTYYTTKTILSLTHRITVFEACESISGYITNDYQHRISYLSTKLAVDSNVSSLLKQAAVRSLSCEVVPKKEGNVYFGDSFRGHVLSTTFFLKDAQARGFHRWYSIVVFMRDKHFLLNSWPFFQEHINQIIEHLQKKAAQVYSEEQIMFSQRALRLSCYDHKHSFARSLVKLTASTNVFAQIHLWFTWLLSTGARRLEEHLPNQKLNGKLLLVQEEYKNPPDDAITNLRELRSKLGAYNFHRILHAILTGQQVIVRGPKIVVIHIINLLKLFLPKKKVICKEFEEMYKSPEICNIIGLDLCVAVPKSSENITRLDIVPSREMDILNLTEAYKYCRFIVKNESLLPEKLPTLLTKIDKALSDQSLTNLVVNLYIRSLMEQWVYAAKVIQETKKKQSELFLMGLMQILGIQEQDSKLIEFWTS